MLPIPRKVWCLQLASMVPGAILAAAAWTFTLSLAYVALMHFIDGEIGTGIGVLVLTVLGTPLAQGIAECGSDVLAEPFMIMVERTDWGQMEPASDEEARQVAEEMVGIFLPASIAATVVFTIAGFAKVLASGALDQWT